MIYTFYSYKGGVGRSMALANVAELFYQAGLKVLMIDWDLEAPGLERFFFSEKGTAKILDKPGVMDMLLGYKKLMAQELSISEVEGEQLPFEKPEQFIVDMYPNSSSKGKLWLLSAGRRSAEHFSEYANAVLTFDWQDFYLNWEGARYFEWLRQQFERIADAILIDSRTGVTELGGVCSYQFADVIVMFCSANQQNLEGTYRMLLDFKDPHVRELRGRSLEVLVVPARIESGESDFLNEFQGKFLDLFTEYTPPVLGTGSDLFGRLAIPYTPRYAYREIIAVRERSTASARSIAEAFSQLTFTISRLAPKDSAIRLALPETEIAIGGETVVGSVVAGAVVVGDKVVSTGVGDFVGRDKIETHIFAYPRANERQHYLDGLLARYEYWRDHYTPLAGIAEVHAAVKNSSRLDMPMPFIPPGFEKLVDHGYGEQVEVRREPVDDLRIAVEEYRCIVLLGNPGSGKTTTLWRLAYDYATTAQEDDQAPLPLLVPLGGYTDDGPFDDYLSRHLGPLAPYLDTYRASGRLILLLDGLNEMPQADYVERVERIQNVLDRYPTEMVIVTCRTLDYVVKLKRLQKVEVSPLDETRIRTFLCNYLGETAGERLFREMIGSDGEPSPLLTLGHNPYMLLMLAQVYAASGGELPTSRARLVATFVDTLLGREQKRRTREWVETECQKAGLSALAYAMHTEQGTTVERAWAIECIHQAVPDCDTEQLLNLATSATLLDVDEATVRFYHPLFQEYFAALELERRAVIADGS